jgi:hypothetical protein
VSFVVKALTSVCRVNHRPTISHDFLAVAQTDVRQALAAEPIDALPAAVVALAADAPALVEAAACTYCVLAAVAEQA